MKLWMTLGYWRDAADIAKELKDVKTLVMIRYFSCCFFFCFLFFVFC